MHKARLILAIPLLISGIYFFSTLTGYASTDLQSLGVITQIQQWFRRSEPVLKTGKNSWDGTSVYNPNVIFAEGEYKMWYTGDGGNFNIGHAVSSDGINWIKEESNPVFRTGPSGSWDGQFVSGTAVIYEDGLYKMWYEGNQFFDRARSQIGYATSEDGITWEKSELNPIISFGTEGEWDDISVKAMSVIADEDGYKMWFSGRGGTPVKSQIGYATSTDGINWTKYANNPILVLDDGSWEGIGVNYPRVIKREAGYEMWFTGHKDRVPEVGHATSLDGTTWTKNPSNPIFTPDESGWDLFGVSAVAVLEINDELKMWYTGQSYGGKLEIGYASDKPQASTPTPTATSTMTPTQAVTTKPISTTTPTQTATNTPTSTMTPLTTPTLTETPTNQPTSTVAPTSTLQPSPTTTSTSTITSVPTLTHTPTPVDTPSETPAPVNSQNYAIYLPLIMN